MQRILLACLLIGASPLVAAAESKAPPAGTRYVVEIRFEYRHDGETRRFTTSVEGNKGTPIVCDLCGLEDASEPSGTDVKLLATLHCHDIAGTRPTQYCAQIRLTEEKNDGKKRVLAEPTIVATVDLAATFSVGEKDKNGTDVELMFRETQPDKPVVPVLSAKDLPHRLFTNASGNSTSPLDMMMVTPRIIIQEEEEDKLGVDVAGVEKEQKPSAEKPTQKPAAAKEPIPDPRVEINDATGTIVIQGQVIVSPDGATLKSLLDSWNDAKLPYEEVSSRIKALHAAGKLNCPLKVIPKPKKTRPTNGSSVKN